MSKFCVHEIDTKEVSFNNLFLAAEDNDDEWAGQNMSVSCHVS